MRKFIGAGAIAALSLALLASTASASFDPHFSVIAKQTSGHQGQSSFRFKDRLFNPANLHDRVGRDWGRCKFRHHVRKIRCRALAHLNGDIGGFGDIRVRGTLGHHDNRLNVVGGTHDFRGVAGKVTVHTIHGNTDRLHFALVR